MTEKKRYEYWKDSDTAYDTKIRYGQYFRIIDKRDMVYLLNEQEELIKRLKTIREEQTETILKQKRKMQELEERNKRQYNRLKEITDLMSKRDWKTLENIADEWEKQEKLLNQEWNNCEDL